MFSKIVLANNTTADLRDFPDMLNDLREHGQIDPKLHEIFTVKQIEVADGIRFVLDWA